MSHHHESFQTVKGSLNWDHPLYKLYEKAKKLGNWNPADIDLSQDVKDFQSLRTEERITALPLIAAFSAGEEAVTIDILPMMHALANQGRLEDTMYLTTFVYEEAKHTEMFARWQEAVGIAHMDLSVFHTDSYKRIFYEALPESMNRLLTDDSPEAIIRAATVYNMVVEGILAESGYNAFREIFRKAGYFPGLLKAIDYLNMDEGRHIQFGTYTIQRLVVGNEKNFKIFNDYIDELWVHASAFIDYLTDLNEQQQKYITYETRIKVEPDLLKSFAERQYNLRKEKIARAKNYDTVEELEKALSSSS